MLDTERIEQQPHRVEQGTLVSIGQDHALVDPAGQRHGEHALGRRDEHGYGLEGMAHDELRLGVGVRLLVKELDGGHLAAARGTLDAVVDEDQSPNALIN